MSQRAVQLQIACTSYSGSTLLGLLLADHPQVVFCSQLSDLSTATARGEHCTCGAPFAECEFWRSIAEQLSNRANVSISFDVETTLRDAVPHPATAVRAGERAGARLARQLISLRPTQSMLAVAARVSPHAAHMSDVAAAVATVAAAVGVATGAALVVDATKYAEVVAARVAADPALRLVHLVRDARGVMASRMRRRGDSPALAAKTWVVHNLRLLAIAATLPRDRVLRLRYEDVCADPRAQVRRVLQFAGVAVSDQRPADAMLQLHKRSQHLVGGNPMRFSFDDDTIALDERWRDELNSDALMRYRVLAAWLNRRFGYR